MWTRQNAHWLFSLFAAFNLTACGTYVPQIEQSYEGGVGQKSLQRKIKEHIYCELHAAVYGLNNDPGKSIYVGRERKRPVPESWGVSMTLTLTIVENSSLTPNVAVSSPLPSHLFTLNLSGQASSEATRIDKYTFFYLISDLEKPTNEFALLDDAHPNGRGPDDFRGSSRLLTSNLGILPWLNESINVRIGLGVSERSKQDVLSYQVRFNAISRGDVTPSWSLERVTANSGTFFSSKRDRTHELFLTFGPAEPSLPTPKGTRPPQPRPLVLSSDLASQVGSAISNSINSSALRIGRPF